MTRRRPTALELARRRAERAYRLAMREAAAREETQPVAQAS